MPQSDRQYETYLGDGVYAWTDGYQIWLRAERNDTEHRIALEPSVLQALISYERDLRDLYATRKQEATDAAE